MTKHGKAYDSLPMTADDSFTMTADDSLNITADDSLNITADDSLNITGLHYIKQDKIEPNCEKFNLRTNGQTDSWTDTRTSAGVELRLRS